MKRQASTPPPLPAPAPAADTTVEQPPAAPPTEAPGSPATQQPRRPARQASPGGTAPSGPAPSAPATAGSSVAPAASPTVPAPRLGAILTAEQQRQFNASIDQSLSRTQATLNAVVQRALTKEQQGIVDQVQTFIQQAQATRKSDLVAAKSLADRAEVLARDLAGTLR